MFDLHVTDGIPDVATREPRRTALCVGGLRAHHHPGKTTQTPKPSRAFDRWLRSALKASSAY